MAEVGAAPGSIFVHPAAIMRGKDIVMNILDFAVLILHDREYRGFWLITYVDSIRL